MPRRWGRYPWALLAVVVAAPLLVLGIAELLPRPPVRPPPMPLASAAPSPLLSDQPCGLGATPPSTSSPASVPTLGPLVPTPREGDLMFYDPIHNDVVTLGGYTFPTSGNGGAQTLADAWTLDFRGWHRGASPSSAPGLIVEDDQAGGLTATGPTGGGVETFRWDGQSWAPLARLPLDNGWTVAGAEPLGNTVVLVAENLQDTYASPATRTWTWNGTAWTVRRPTTNLPVGSGGPVFSADPVHRRVVAVLTANASGATQTWAWSGSTWRLVASTYKLGLDPISATMAPDPQTGAVLLYMDPPGSAACTWALEGSTWRELEPASPSVDTAYEGAALLTDTAIGRVILIGGPTRPNPLNILWVFDGSAWRAEPASALGGD